MGLCLLILLAIVLGPPATASAIPELRDHAFTHLADEPMAAAHSRVPPAGGPVKISERYGRLPLAFEVNDGQTDPRVKFLARAGGHRLFLTSTEAVMVFRPSRSAPSPLRRGSVARSERSLEERRASAGPPSVVRMRLLGGNPAARVTGGEELPGRVNYFIGNDPARWHTNIRTYAKVKYENVYPGIDLVYYGNAQRLEYDVIVGPGVDPGVITIAFEGVDALEVDASGDVVMHTPGGIVRQARPFIYQEINGVKQPVSGRHRLKGAPSSSDSR